MPRPSRWWSRARGLPPDVHTAWTASLSAMPGREPRILAWARAEEGYVIGSPAALSVSDGPDWLHLGWHQIERGGWQSDRRRLGWATYDGTGGEVGLAEPGRLPELFKERVAASIVVERFVPVPGSREGSGRGIVVHGRRDLGDDGEPIHWHASLGRGASWAQPGLREAADAVIIAMRAEYDPH